MSGRPEIRRCDCNPKIGFFASCDASSAFYCAGFYCAGPLWPVHRDAVCRSFRQPHPGPIGWDRATWSG
jgi:hypothetical protein